MPSLHPSDDPEFQCGDNLRYIRRSLHQPRDSDPAETLVIDLAEVTRALLQVLVSSQIMDRALGREFRAESAKALILAAARLAGSHDVATHA